MLSICLITKNEEKNIERCLNSVKSIADEIIIVDTGSKDRTVDIAKSFGAKIYHSTWENDFSKARNFAIDKCTKEWIFIIDADEELYREHSNLLKEKLANSPKIEAVYLRLINIIGTTSINETLSLRIFRNRANYRYIGKLHEQIFFSIKESNTDESFEITHFILNHYGYDHNVINMDAKIKRNLDILEGTAEEERDGFFYFSVGSEYLKLNDILKAKEYLLKSSITPSKDYGNKPYLVISLSRIFLDLKQFQSGINYIKDNLHQLYDFKDLYFLEASLYFEMMKFTKSYISLTKFINLAYNPSKYPSFNFENCNDINLLLEYLKLHSIPKSNDYLTTVIKVKNSGENIENVIKNVNEISDEVVVLSNIKLSDDIEERIYECNGKLVYSNEANMLKYEKGWILNLNEGDILTHDDRVEISHIMNNLQFKSSKTYNLTNNRR